MKVGQRTELKLLAPLGDLQRYAHAIGRVADAPYEPEPRSASGSTPIATTASSSTERSPGPEVVPPRDSGATGAMQSDTGPRDTFADDAASSESVGAFDRGSSSDGPNDDLADNHDGDDRFHFTCPNCHASVAVHELPDGGLVHCPSCEAQFFAVSEVSDIDRDELDRMEQDRQARERHLGDLHQNKVLLERRALFRGRTYLTLLLGVCLFVALQLSLYSSNRYYHDGYSPRLLAYGLCVIGCVAVSVAALRKIRRLNAELRRPLLPDPTTPPDFSTLSDGSQLAEEEARNLEKLWNR